MTHATYKSILLTRSFTVLSFRAARLSPSANRFVEPPLQVRVVPVDLHPLKKRKRRALEVAQLVDALAPWPRVSIQVSDFLGGCFTLSSLRVCDVSSREDLLLIIESRVDSGYNMQLQRLECTFWNHLNHT